MVDSHENWNHLIIRRFSLKVDSRENENTQKLFSHEEVVFSFYGWTILLFLLGEILLTIPKKNACFRCNSLITNGLIFIRIRHSLIGEFTLLPHLHRHFFAQAVRNLRLTWWQLSDYLVTTWRLLGAHLGHYLGHYLGRTLYLTCFLTSGSLPVSLPVLSLSIKKGYHILWHPILLQELRPLLSPSLSPYSG